MRILLILSMAIFIIGCQTNTDMAENPVSESNNLLVNGLSEELCIKAGGRWNECGSPCAGTGADFCIQVCSPQCECDNINFKCPTGFYCRLSGKPKETGVCVHS